ncbi:26S proteasome non-ATPase regulatory subunit [Dirofilaria immitis]
MTEYSLPYSTINDNSNDIFVMWGLTLRTATILCTFAQIALTLSSSLFMYIYLPNTIVISILISLSLFCCSVAVLFIFIRIWKRIFGLVYDTFLHGYLLSILLMALISFFEVMYFPLCMIQTFTDWSSPSITYYSVLIILSTITLFLQFLLRSLKQEGYGTMRDNNVESSAESPPAIDSTYDVDTFYEMKQRLLTDRTEVKAIEILQKLLSHNMEHIDWDAFPDLKDLIICILDTVGIVSLTEKHQILVLNGINNSHPRVVDVLVDYYIRHVDEVYEMLSNSHIAVTIAFARRICDFDCAGSIAVLLTRFASLKLVHDELLNQLSSNRAEVRFRIHQVTTLVMREGGDLHKIGDLVNRLAEELESTDILIQINAVEMFADGVSQKVSAARYLLSTGIVDHLNKLFIQCMDQPDAGFLYPALIKFFGHLSVANVECLSQFPKFLDSLFDLIYHFDRLDASLRLLAFDTLGAVGSTDCAKKFLDSQHNNCTQCDMRRAMNAFGVAIASGPLDLRVRHINALSMMLEVKDENKDVNADAVAQKWFNWLGETFPSIVISYLSKPFNDIRISALRLVLALFDHPWAIRVFYFSAGFLVSILNRNIESSAEGKQCKYDVICKLIDSANSVISPEDMIRLKMYRREGAFYIERNPQIDMGND